MLPSIEELNKTVHKVKTGICMVPSINKLNKTLHKVKTDICMVPSINKLNKTMNKAKMIFKSEFPSNIYNSHSTLMKSYQQVGVSLTDLLFHRDKVDS